MTTNQTVAFWGCLVMSSVWVSTADSASDFVIGGFWIAVAALHIAASKIRSVE